MKYTPIFNKPLNFNKMEISTNITEAQKNYPEMYHVVSSNEVHSFETIDEAIKDLIAGIDAEKKLGTGFTPELFTPELIEKKQSKMKTQHTKKQLTENYYFNQLNQVKPGLTKYLPSIKVQANGNGNDTNFMSLNKECAHELIYWLSSNILEEKDLNNLINDLKELQFKRYF